MTLAPEPTVLSEIQDSFLLVRPKIKNTQFKNTLPRIVLHHELFDNSVQSDVRKGYEIHRMTNSF